MSTLNGGAGNDVLVGTEIGGITRVSTGPQNLPTFGNAGGGAFSPDGTKVVFHTEAALVAADTNILYPDIYVKDLATGAVTLVSANAAGVVGNSWSYDAVYSPDGTKVMFRSAASNLVAGDTNGAEDIFIKDLATGAVTRVTLGPSGEQSQGSASGAVFSPDGTKIAYVGSGYDSWVNGGQIYVKDLATGVETLVTVDVNGNPAAVWGNYGGNSQQPVFSPDGTKLGFYSLSALMVPGDVNYWDAFVADLATGVITRVSTNAAGDVPLGDTTSLSFSPDGTKVMFISKAGNLVAGDTNGNADLFIKDLATGVVTRVSTGPAGEELFNSPILNAAFSPDGSRIVFATGASTLVAGDTNGADVFIRELATGATIRVSTGVFGNQANWDATGGIFSPDGTKVLFLSGATNLVLNDPTGIDLFLKDLLETGADLINGGDGHDQITGLSADDELHGGEGNDLIQGDDTDLSTPDGADRLYGDNGADVLIGGRGNDILDGGAGDDILINGVAPGTISPQGVASAGVYANVDGGDDQMDGGDGFDRAVLFYIDRTAPIVFDNSNTAAVNTVWVGGVASGSVTRVEQINIRGGSAGDTITLGAGNDFLWGLGGDDVLDGGAGIDAAVYDEKTQSVRVTLDGANAATVYVGGVAEDRLRNIEGVFGGRGDDVLTGDGLANTLSGAAGSDVLAGRGGADLINGEEGVDTALYDEKTLSVSVTLNGGINAIVYVGGVAEDTMRNVENLVGGSAGDSLTGDGLDNILDGRDGHDTLSGGDGNDTLIGGAGDDVLNGGAGVDIASYASATSGVTVALALAGVQATGGAGNDTLTGIEVVQGSDWNDVLTGDGVENGLIGGAGQDWLQGLNGADVLSGGDGHDSVWGGAGDDILDGGPGDDTLDGGAGTDTASYLTALSGVTVDLSILDDQNTHGAGVDTLVSIENLVGSAFDDVLYGTTGVNAIDGGDGADVIYGRGGGDRLTGGAGGDTFVIAAGRSFDRITDFTSTAMVSPGAAHDRIDLSGIDADTGLAGRQAFHFGATAGHTGDVLVYMTDSEDGFGYDTIILYYTNGDAITDGYIILNTYHPELTAADFIL